MIVQTLSGATTSVNGTTVDFGPSGVRNLTFQIVATGTVTAGAVTMQVSEDGTNWFAPPTATLTSYSAVTAGNPYTVVTNTPALFGLTAGNYNIRFARVNVSTSVTGGATVSASIAGV